MPTIAPTAAVTGDPASSGSLGRLATDMTMFLKLLTTQMQNQDPLNPMDTSEYTQQLVQFSQVEQAIAQNSKLESILDRLSGQELIGASALVGSTGTFASAMAGLTEDQPASWSYAVGAGAVLPAAATISDASGAVVATRQIESREGLLAWDGLRDGGGRAAAGGYVLTIKASAADGAAVASTVAARGVVQEVSASGDGIVLRAGGIDYPLASMTGTAGR